MSIIENFLVSHIVSNAKAIQAWREMNKTKFYYNFKGDPYCRAEQPNGDVYVMQFDGTSYLVSGSKLMLTQGCPYPWKVGAVAYFYMWCHTHPRQLTFIILGAILALVSYAVMCIVDPQNPSRYIIAPIMNVTLFLVVCVMFLIAFLKAAGPALLETGEDVWRRYKGQTKALNAGDFHIGEDILVYSFQNESGFDFEERTLAAKEKQKATGKLLFIVPYDSVYMQVIYPDGWVEKVTGHLVPDVESASDNWHKDKSPLDIKDHRRRGSGYMSETYDQYLSFVRAVCPAFRAWSEEQKMSFKFKQF